MATNEMNFNHVIDLKYYMHQRERHAYVLKHNKDLSMIMSKLAFCMKEINVRIAAGKEKLGFKESE